MGVSLKEKLSAVEAMKVLGVSRGTFYKLVRTGKLPKQVSLLGRGLGGQHTYYLRGDVLRLVKGSLDAKP